MKSNTWRCLDELTPIFTLLLSSKLVHVLYLLLLHSLLNALPCSPTSYPQLCRPACRLGPSRWSEIFSLLFLKNSPGHSEITWELPKRQSRHFHLLGTDWTSNDCVGAVGCAWLISSVLLLTCNSGWLHFINLFQVNCPSSIANQTTTFTFCHRV